MFGRVRENAIFIWRGTNLMKQLLILLVVNICLCQIAIAQKEFNNWFFGSHSALNFGTGSPVFAAGSSMVSQEGCSSISDKQGNLLFYTNGVTVWNRNHTIMLNGSGLNGDDGSTQSVLITNHPGNNNIYYIFTTPKDGGTNSLGLYYSVVNMSLNGGLGDVDVSLGKNVDFNLRVCEKVTAVKHRNGNDIWVIARRFESTQFVVYLVNCSGLIAYPDAFYNAASNIDRPNNAGGYLKGSPDGKTLVAANFHGDIDLFDFDNSNGQITNARVLYSNPGFLCGPYGVEFSPDSKLLYSSEIYDCNTPSTYNIFQYQLTAPNIAASKVILEAGTTNPAGALQLGPDNKVYVAYDQAGFVGAVTNPNVQGPGCSLVRQYVNLPPPALSGLGLPNVSTGFTGYNRSLLGDDTVLCNQTSITLRLSLPNTTIEWNDGTMLDSLVVTKDGKYWVKITHGSCVYSDTVNIKFQSSATIGLGNDTVMCQNKFPYLLKASIPGATYLWQDGSTNSSYSATAGGLYWLQASLNGCVSRDSISITANPVPLFNLGADTTVCANAALPLTVNASATAYLWNTGATSKSITANSSGIYWADATNDLGCSYRDSIKVTLKPVPSVNLGKDTVLCQNKFPLLLTQPITGATYLWQDGSTNPSFSVPAAGLYWLEATVNGCSARDSITVSANTADTFTLGADSIICGTQPLTLTVIPAFSKYLWNNGSTSKSITVSTGGIYWCEATNSFGCSYRDSIQITFKTAPVVNLGKDTALCQNKFPLRLSPSITGATYLWQDGSTNSSFSAPRGGLYWVEATANGCSVRDSISIVENAVDIFNLGADSIICGTQPLTLTVIPAFAKYLWSTGSTSKSINVSSTGLYWCEATNPSGCSYRDSIQITFKAAPVVNLGKDTALCQNKFPLRLSQSITGATYLWQDGSTNSSFLAPRGGLYWVEATVNGCSVRDSISIAENTVDVFSLGSDSIICGTQPLTLTVIPAFAKYLWSNGSTSKSISVNSTGLYWCEATNGSGCTYRDTINLAFNPSSIVNLGNDTLVCQDKLPILLGKNISNATYLWQDGSTNAFYNANGAGLYWVQATINGCSSRDSITVTIGTATVFNLGADISSCANQAVTLSTSQSFTKYLWNTGSTATSINVNNSGNYWLEATNNLGCSYRDTINVSFKPAPIINLGKDTTVCQVNLPFQVGQTIAGAAYLWQDGSTNAFYSITGPGVYWMQATVNGCSARDSITVSTLNAQGFNLGADTLICNAQPLLLGVNGSFTTYLWSTGSTNKNISVTISGSYWLEASNSGCSYRDTINVTFRPAPSVNIGSDTILCQANLPFQIGQTIGGASYLWQDGSTSAFYSVSGQGLYWLEATLNGCAARDSIKVTVTNASSFSLGADTVICNSQPLVLGVNGSFNKYIWSTGSTSKNITVNRSGDYWLEASTNSGCSYRDSIHVDFKSPPVFSLGRDTIVCNGGSYLLSVSNAGDRYLWQDNSTQPQYLVTKSGFYYVLVNKGGCSSADSVAVMFKSKPAPDLGDDKAICPGEELLLNPSVAGTTFTWQDGSKDLTYKVITPGKYTVVVTNECGIGSDEVIVSSGACKLLVPNAFTPGKRTNNTFRLVNAFGLDEFRLQVFNRWGEQVYQTSNSADGWDGKYKGIEQSSGMYVYIISYKDAGERKTQRGTVMLVR